MRSSLLLLFGTALHINFFELVKSFPNGDRHELHHIVGGNETDISEVPYTASLLYHKLTGPTFLCGGVILSESFIVTAAHCVTISSDAEFSVRTGSSYTDRGGKVNKVVKIIVYPEYTADSDYDIALLKLDEPLEFNNNTQPISLIPQEPEFDEPIRVSGWGQLSVDGPYPDKLRSVIVKVVSKEKCREAYAGLFTDRMICASSPGKDACFGDSGGPAVHSTGLAGLVSFGYSCAHPKYPSVYTSIGNQEISLFITNTIGIRTNSSGSMTR